jgi:hypothetical protein
MNLELSLESPQETMQARRSEVKLVCTAHPPYTVDCIVYCIVYLNLEVTRSI